MLYEYDFQISFQNELKLHSDKRIKDYFFLKFGAKLYEVGKGNPKQDQEASKNHIYEASRQIDKSYKRLLKARSVQRYHLLWTNFWVKYGPNLAAPRDPEIFNGNRILLQRIVSKDILDAVFTNEEYVCNTDVITLKPLSEEVDCKLFVAIINSKLCI